ncbi:MAG: MurR/RpiR family transcriptional regulator [Lachnospiraceae bacterium]
MHSALIRLRESKSTASMTEKLIIEYLLQFPASIMDLSIYQLATKTFSSPSTIIRMCKRIGFSGYKDFRRSMIYELALREQTLEKERAEIAREDSIEQIIEKTTYKNIVCLEDTKNLLDPQTIHKCVDLLSKSNRILLFGIGASLCVAKDFYLKFLRLNKACIINDDYHSQRLQAYNSKDTDVAIIFSYSGETEEMVTCIKELQSNNTPSIAITRYASSAIADLATYNLYIAASESTFRSGAMSSRISQLNIVDILFVCYASTQYDYFIEQLNRTHIDKPHITRPK